MCRHGGYIWVMDVGGIVAVVIVVVVVVVAVVIVVVVVADIVAVAGKEWLKCAGMVGIYGWVHWCMAASPPLHGGLELHW